MQEQNMERSTRQPEATIFRIIGLVGFILAVIAFFLVTSSVSQLGGDGNDTSSVLFMSFIMCAALAFIGLMISALAQILRSLQNIEYLLSRQMAAPPSEKAGKTPAAGKKTVKKTAKKK